MNCSPALNKPLRTLEEAQYDRMIKRLTLLANRLEHDGLMQRNGPTADAANWGNHLVQDATIVRQAIRELEK